MIPDRNITSTRESPSFIQDGVCSAVYVGDDDVCYYCDGGDLEHTYHTVGGAPWTDDNPYSFNDPRMTPRTP